MQKRHTVVPTVHLFIEKDGKTLLQRRMNTGWQDGMYCPVAGHVEQGETIRQAGKREAKEEAGIKIDIEDLDVIHVMHRKGNDYERLDFFLIAKKWHGEPAIIEPDKCDELCWFLKDKLPSNMIPYIKKAFECIEQGIIYSEYDWEDSPH